MFDGIQICNLIWGIHALGHWLVIVGVINCDKLKFIGFHLKVIVVRGDHGMGESAGDGRLLCLLVVVGDCYVVSCRSNIEGGKGNWQLVIHIIIYRKLQHVQQR
jgi:hypothetical protein